MKKNYTGIQGCIEGILLSKTIDKNLRINSSFVISGYRGSPLASFDKECAKRKDEFENNNITFINGLNEELALAAVAGTQQFHYFGKPKNQNKDGAAGFWYAKGPGVDRAMDSIHHYSYQGTTKFGGVVLFCGNDTIMSSSTMPHDTSPTLASIYIPIITPSNVEDLVEFTVKSLYLSRYSGSYVAISVVTDIADSYQTVDIDEIYKNIFLDFYAWKSLVEDHDNGGFVLPDNGDLQEKRIFEKRIPNIKKFNRIFPFDKIIGNGNCEKGIVCVGRLYEDLKCLVKLNGDIDILKIGCAWPLNEEIVYKFIKNKKEILILEEKTSLVENQIKNILYEEKINIPVLGKNKLPPYEEINIANLEKIFFDFGVLKEKKLISIQSNNLKNDLKRIPYFCGGCPHNTSTKLPQNELAVLGIGCHYLASFMPDRPTITVCPMGSEGVPWISISKLTERDHLFVNLGDGTYYHSGSLAIRFAVATNTKVTFKILFNSAVAMTGGQPIDGPLTLESLIEQIQAEGVKNIVVISHYYDDKDYMAKIYNMGVEVYPKNKIIDVQKKLKNYDGVSVLIYDQMCATEKRRKEKRNIIEKTKYKIDINEKICDACGDCQKKSNCLAIGINYKNPYLPTRYIDRSLCNDDFSCNEGFCPSFGMFEIKKNKKSIDKKIINRMIELVENQNSTEKVLPHSYTISILGIGGTGTSTLTKIISDSLAMNDYYIMAKDKTGLAQRFGEIKGTVHANLSEAKTNIKEDLVIVIDPLVFLNYNIDDKNTVYVINSNVFNIPSSIHEPEKAIRMNHEIKEKLNKIPENKKFIENFSFVSEEFFGTKQYINSIILGYCVGKIRNSPFNPKYVIESMKNIFGKYSEDNINAFLVGMNLAVNSKILEKLKNKEFSFEETLKKYDKSGKILSEFEFCKEKIENLDIEEKLKTRLKRAIFDLLYVKDEYEVSRLWLEYFEENNIKDGWVFLSLFGNKKRKISVKIAKVMFKILKKLTFLRNTVFDIHLLRKDHRLDFEFRKRMLGNIKSIILFTYDNKICDISKNELEYMLTDIEKARGFGHVRRKFIEKIVG